MPHPNKSITISIGIMISSIIGIIISALQCQAEQAFTLCIPKYNILNIKSCATCIQRQNFLTIIFKNKERLLFSVYERAKVSLKVWRDEESEEKFVFRA